MLNIPDLVHGIVTPMLETQIHVLRDLLIGVAVDFLLAREAENRSSIVYGFGAVAGEFPGMEGRNAIEHNVGKCVQLDLLEC